MADVFTFAALNASDVTDIRKNSKSEQGQSGRPSGKRTEAHNSGVVCRVARSPQKWKFAEIDFDKNSNVDTDKVTSTLDESSVAAVTFLGQQKKYYAGWLE